MSLFNGKEKALDALTNYMAEQLYLDERRAERESNFRKQHVRRLKFQDKRVAPVVEKIKRKYSSGECPECARRYKIFEAVVLRGDDPGNEEIFKHVCKGSARIRQRRPPSGEHVKPTQVDSNRSQPSSFEEDILA